MSTLIQVRGSAQFQPDHCTPEVIEKMKKITKLSDAILAARKRLQAEPGYNTAMAVQQLERQRQELRGTLPRIKLVWVNPERA